MRGERAGVGTDLDEGWVEELDLFLTEVGEVPQREGATVVHATGDEGGAREKMEFPDAVNGRFGFECAFGVLGIKVDRKHLCPVMGLSGGKRVDEGTYWADCMANTAGLVGSELRTTPP